MNKEVIMCEVCSKEFKVKRGLQKHKKKFHPELFDYKCEICGEMAEDLKGLMIHVAKKHKNSKEYFDTYLAGKEKCKFVNCDKYLDYDTRYSGNYCSQQHYECQKKLNEGVELKYECELCNSLYETVGSLQHHLTRVHNFNESDRVKYYDKHFKTDDEGCCKYCGKNLKLLHDSFSLGYMSFCYNKDCNVRWHNENTNRLEKASKSSKITYKNHPERLSTKIEYWIAKGYSKDVAKEKLKERQQTFSKEICIEKYGEIEGFNRWKLRQEQWQNTIDSKSDEEKMRINRLKAYSSGCISTAEKELCKLLDGESQFIISSDIGYVFDIRKGNKIIEYNGDYWHCNPKKYKEDFYNKSIRMTAKEKWDFDSKKLKYAKDNGYEVLVIWENDYNANKESIIKECLEFISR